jgi:hypothetical protein
MHKVAKNGQEKTVGAAHGLESVFMPDTGTLTLAGSPVNGQDQALGRRSIRDNQVPVVEGGCNYAGEFLPAGLPFWGYYGHWKLSFLHNCSFLYLFKCTDSLGVLSRLFAKDTAQGLE